MTIIEERVSMLLKECKRAVEKRLDSIDAHISAVRRDMWIGFGAMTTITFGGFITILARLG